VFFGNAAQTLVDLFVFVFDVADDQQGKVFGQ
jgi:hypothetical protein